MRVLVFAWCCVCSSVNLSLYIHLYILPYDSYFLRCKSVLFLPTATLAPMIAIPKLSQKPWIIHTNCIAIVANLFFYISIELAPILGFLKLKLIIAIHSVIHEPEVPNLFINFEFIIIYALHEAFVHIWHVPYIMSLYNLGNVRITHFRVPQRWLSASRVVKGLVPLTSKNCIPTDKGYQKVAVIYQ